MLSWWPWRTRSGRHVRVVVVMRWPVVHAFPGARRRQRRRLRQVRRAPLPRHQHRQVRRLQHGLHLEQPKHAKIFASETARARAKTPPTACLPVPASNTHRKCNAFHGVTYATTTTGPWTVVDCQAWLVLVLPCAASEASQARGGRAGGERAAACRRRRGSRAGRPGA